MTIKLQRDFFKHSSGVQMARYQFMGDDNALKLLTQTICNDVRHVALNDKLALAEATRRFGVDAVVEIV